MLPPLMFLHWLFAIEFLMANVAFKRPIISVGSFVHPKISFLCVLLATNFTTKRLFPGMGDQMTFHCGNTYKTFAANSTNWQNFGSPLSNTCFICFENVGQHLAVFDKTIADITVRRNNCFAGCVGTCFLRRWHNFSCIDCSNGFNCREM